MTPQQVLSTDPRQAIRELSDRGATGELICVSSAAEVHVYLQSGRVAWATSSGSRFVFSKDLIARCDMDRDTFKELLEECRRTHRPLGETLVEWGLATKAQVRAALESQVRDALQTLAHGSAGSTLFLERSRAFERYDAELTFDVAELLHDMSPPQSGVWPEERSTRLSSLTRKALTEVPGVLWSQVGDGQGAARRYPAGQHPMQLPLIAWNALEDDVVFAAVRSGRGTALGFGRASGGRHLWLGMQPEQPLGGAMAGLAVCFDHPAFRCSRPAGDASPGPVRVQSAPPGPTCQEILQLFERSGELIALAVFAEDDICMAVGRVDTPARELFGPLRAKQSMLEIARSGAFPVKPHSAESLGFHFASMALLTDTQWAYCSEVTDGSERVVWLLLQRQASQGLGWALATSVNRLLAGRSASEETP